jgi:hypothetical protein
MYYIINYTMNNMRESYTIKVAVDGAKTTTQLRKIVEGISGGPISFSHISGLKAIAEEAVL